MSRCDLNFRLECSCIASGAPCKDQTPVYLLLEDANNAVAQYGTRDLILLSIIVFAIIIGLGAQVAPAAI